MPDSRTLRAPRSTTTILALAALGAAIVTGPASAQPVPGANSSWEINLHAAGMQTALFDETGQGFQYGGRLLKNFGNGLAFGASVDRATASGVALAPYSDLDASLLLYSAGLEYRFRVASHAEFLLGAGAGAATLSFDAAPSGVQESSTGLLVPVGGGFKVFGSPRAPAWAFRIDVRDNVILLDTPTPSGDVTTEPRNNFEVSAGLSILLGSDRRPDDRLATPRPVAPEPRKAAERPRPAPADRPADRRADEAVEADIDREAVADSVPSVAGGEADHDGDGVADDEDACPGTPAGIPVDSMGCLARPPTAGPPEADEPAVVGPGPDDEDGDGVIDDRDACPGTPIGISVDEEGCLARLPAREGVAEADRARPSIELPDPDAADAPRCLGSQEWYGEGEIVEYDGRPFEAVGDPKTVDSRFLIQVGTHRNVPILVSDTARPPYHDFWMPVCDVEDGFELYIESTSLPWNP